jgi:endonuclease/exonuclease/phosphatase family metal-dependent hydrolase
MRLKIVTYNIKSGLYHPDGLEAVARVLEAASPDVIALQEVDRDTRRARHEDQTAWLAGRLGMPYHCFGAATPWDGGGEYGVSLISAFPLLEQNVTHLWVPQGKDVPHGAREPRVVLSAKLAIAPDGDESGPGERGGDDAAAGAKADGATRGEADAGSPAAAGGTLTVMVTHFGLTDEQRRRQAHQLLGLAHGADDGKVVVTGDLNGRPDSPEVRVLADALHDVLGHVPETERITFPSGDPEMHGRDFLARTIDYIFIGDGARVEGARVIADHSLASDHNPCEATLHLPKARPSAATS